MPPKFACFIASLLQSQGDRHVPDLARDNEWSSFGITIWVPRRTSISVAHNSLRTANEFYAMRVPIQDKFSYTLFSSLTLSLNFTNCQAIKFQSLREPTFYIVFCFGVCLSTVVCNTEGVIRKICNILRTWNVLHCKLARVHSVRSHLSVLEQFFDLGQSINNFI